MGRKDRGGGDSNGEREYTRERRGYRVEKRERGVDAGKRIETTEGK